jgi:DNA-directed RNA polymerase specialized sigma24 family protein
MEPRDLCELIRRAQAGDRQAAEELVPVIRPWLEQAARAFADPKYPEATVSDLVQDAQMAVWRKLAEFRGCLNEEETARVFRVWLAQIVNHLGINRARHRNAGKRKPPNAIVHAVEPLNESGGPGLDPASDSLPPCN